MIIVLLGMGLLAVLLLVGRHQWRALRWRREYEARRAERSVRVYEDVCWMVYRQTEAELAVSLWRCENPFSASDAVRNMTGAFRSFSVPVKEASARLARLNALLASDPERRV